MFFSKKLWLNHANFETRPVQLGRDVKQELERLDSLVSENKIIKTDLLRNDTWWIPFRATLTQHSTATERSSLSLEETRAVLDNCRRILNNY